MFLAITRKEVQENLLWAALGLAAVSLAFYAGVGPKEFGLFSWLGLTGSLSFYERLPLLTSRLLAYTTVIYALFGGALGLLQTLPESRRGTYAVLVHRPIGRGRVLTAKLLAGSALYFAAGGLPMLAAVVWAAVPGHFAAPFRIEMAGAVFADMICGFVFYLAAVLTGVRRARWYGTRLAGIVFAVVVMGLVHAVPWFAAALLIELGAALVLLWAAYAAFLGRDF